MNPQEKMIVEYQPIKKVIIHSMYELTYDEFINEIFLYQNPVNIYWADGYLFTLIPIQADGNPAIMKDFIDGISHWQEVTYCKAEKPPNMIIKSGGAWESKIMDATKMHPQSDFVSWLKNKDKK